MDHGLLTQLDSHPITGPGLSTARVLVAVPFYKNPQLVAPLAASLHACAADFQAAEAEIVFYNDSPDHPELAEALHAACATLAQKCPCRIETNEANMGFVRTMNRAVAEAVAQKADLLMLNSDAEMEPGCLPEMLRVAAIDHMIGFVNPRSNNATLATLELRGPASNRAAMRASFAQLAALLPAYSYIPTAVGYCMLIRWRVLAEFGGLDEVYGHGYNEENDLVMRASRCGFRAVLANHAFAWHEGEASFSTAAVDRATWEPANRAILDKRYPEYGDYTEAYYHTPETVAAGLIAATLPDSEGMRDLAFDFSSFRAAHNGTFQAGKQLLAHAAAAWGPKWRVHVICETDVYDFHNLGPLGIHRADPHEARRFAAIFRVGQPYDWNVLQRLCVSAPVIGVYMLDTISIDCPQLASQFLYNIWHFTLEHADVIAGQSRQTLQQFNRRFTIPAQTKQIVSYHSLDTADYVLPGVAALATPRHAQGRILVLGNHFHHKYLSQTANQLARAFPAREIAALGPDRTTIRPNPMAPPPLHTAANLTIIPVGALTDDEIGAQYEAADIIIFPSHAEGFGFPALNALAARKPLFVRRLPVFEELWHAHGCTPNIHFYDSTAELITRLAVLPQWVDHPTPNTLHSAAQSAAEIAAALDQALAHVTFNKLVRRIRAMQFASSFAPHGADTPRGSNAAVAARLLANRVEDVAFKLFSLPPIYAAARLMFRAASLLRFK